jgi:CheY-specific phosphatase CheX
MIEEPVRQLLPASAQRTLETMFFAMPETVSMDPRRPAGERIAASLAFQGSPAGRFGLVVSDPVARTLAANFIGCDESEDLRPDQVAAVIGELANMICGAVLSELESDANFDLCPPRTIHVGADEPDPDFTAGSPSISHFEFPGGALVLFLAFEEPS